VTFLTSAGVQLLHDLAGRGDLELVAPTGTPARFVVDLADPQHLLASSA
jgi:hypothetical protein